MENTVVGVYDSYTQAESAVNELISAGFSRDHVQLTPDTRNASTGQDGVGTAVRDGTESTGSSIGNFFRSLFGMEEHREHHDIYSEAIRRGSHVLTVDAPSDEMRERAIDIMNRYDPVDIDERSAHWRSQGWSGYDESAPRLSDTEIEKDRQLYTQGRDMSLTENAGMNLNPDAPFGQGAANESNTAASSLRSDTTADTTGTTGTMGTTGTTTGQDTQRIPVVEEEMRVGKRQVQRGGVRVYQRVSEKPVHEQVELREEHVNVDRQPADRPATEADLAAFKEGQVELREMAEEAVVSKTARVVEEVNVSKEATQRTEDINDTVRRTDVEVEQLGAADTSRRTGSDYADTAATADDADFRRHWQSAYGNTGGRYEDYDAAYRYGSTLAGTENFRNYRWDDVEPDVRRNWESSHPESTWDKVKDAVRYGAEKVTGRGSSQH
jgi:uncharacterized protein (TIGR02271 family)